MEKLNKSHLISDYDDWSDQDKGLSGVRPTLSISFFCEPVRSLLLFLYYTELYFIQSNEEM